MVGLLVKVGALVTVGVLIHGRIADPGGSVGYCGSDGPGYLFV